MRTVASLILCGALVAAALFFSSIAPAQAAAEQSWPTREWPTASPEAEGMDSAGLAKLVSFGATRSFDSLLVARSDKVTLTGKSDKGTDHNRGHGGRRSASPDRAIAALQDGR